MWALLGFFVPQVMDIRLWLSPRATVREGIPPGKLHPPSLTVFISTVAAVALQTVTFENLGL